VSLAIAFQTPLRRHRHRIDRCAALLAERALDCASDAIAQASDEIAVHSGIEPRLARLALEAALSRLEPRTAPSRPSTIREATAADHSQHGPAPSRCWNCGGTAWWKADDRSSRWLCARCSPPDLSGTALWYEASAADLEDAAREPRWSETPEKDDFLLLSLRKGARNAARTAGDLLGSWRPATARTSADLRTIDWHAITDGAAIIAAAEELIGWALEDDPAAHGVALRALGALLGWPAAALSPVLDHALSLLSAGPSSAAITALGRRWPKGHAPGSADPIPLRVDEATEVLVPAHPHLLLLLLGVRPRPRDGASSRTRSRSKVGAARSASTPSAELVGGKDAGAERPTSKPPTTCLSCRGQTFFRFDAPWSSWACAVCHPPVLPPERFLWSGAPPPTPPLGERGSQETFSAETQR
jgi:hypothetical protein